MKKNKDKNDILEPIMCNKQKNSDIPYQLKIKEQGIVTDPNGSYTGVPTDDPYSLPIQDVDDL